MANNTVEYKFKVTNNLDKDSTIIKKFNFYIGLPYSKRKYRYMQVINFATNKEGQHLFNVVLGHSIDSVAIMTNDILRGTHASLKPVTTKVSRITYTSLNVGTIGLVCNDENEETIKNGDWTGISGEYMKVKSFRTNGNDDVLGLIFDAADRSLVSARKNDNTNVVAKPEAPVDIVKVPQPEKPVIDVDPSEYARCMKENSNLNDRVKDLYRNLEAMQKDAFNFANELREKDRRIKGLKEENKDKDQTISDLKAHIADDDNSIQKQYELIQGYMVTVKDLEEKLEAKDKDISEMGRQIDSSQDYIAELKRENEFTENQAEHLEEKVRGKEAAIDTLTEEIEDRDRRIKSLTEQIGYLQSDLAARDSEIEELLTDVNNLRDQIGATESKPDETQKTFRGKFIDRIVDEFRRRAEALSDEDLLMLMKGTN